MMSTVFHVNGNNNCSVLERGLKEDMGFILIGLRGLHANHANFCIRDRRRVQQHSSASVLNAKYIHTKEFCNLYMLVLFKRDTHLLKMHKMFLIPKLSNKTPTNYQYQVANQG